MTKRNNLFSGQIEISSCLDSHIQIQRIWDTVFGQDRLWWFPKNGLVPEEVVKSLPKYKISHHLNPRYFEQINMKKHWE